MNKNKGVTIEIADIYLRFPEIMEEEFEDLTDFIEDNHILYEGATDIVYNLQQENQQLKENNQAMQEEMAITWEKLKQRDEVIDEAIKFIKDNMTYTYIKKWVAIGTFKNSTEDILDEEQIKELQEILQKYKGESK